MFKVNNAVIMAAGTSSRFAPISYEMPKALITVKGEVLIERQIKQLKEAGINDIIIVVGYKKEKFEYLKQKFNVKLVENREFLSRNNNASIWAVKDFLKNTYICSSDNYFTVNPFEAYVNESYYAAVFSSGYTDEWCLDEDEKGYIRNVTIGDVNKWYMLGHTFWDEKFSCIFIDILEKIYDLPETENLLWEAIYIQHLDVLKMKIRKYSKADIFEFDSLDELRKFDCEYIHTTHSEIVRNISEQLHCKESDLVKFNPYKGNDNSAVGFTFCNGMQNYLYQYANQSLRKI